MKDALRLEVPIAVAIGGALGAVARWGISENFATDPSFPWPTFVANISGSFLLGVVLVLGERFHPRKHRAWARLWRPFLATGVLGGFTTFSTFALELVQLSIDAAITYAVSSVVAGLLAFAIGSGVMRRLMAVSA